MIAMETQHAKKSPETGIYKAIILGMYLFGCSFKRLRQTYIYIHRIWQSSATKTHRKTSRSGLVGEIVPALNLVFELR